MLRRVFIRKPLTVLTAVVVSFCIPLALHGSNPMCPNMQCSPAVACGGQGGIGPPGPMTLCSSSIVGNSCEYCDGTAAIRLCAPLGTGGRECDFIAANQRKKCGNPQKGKCTKTSQAGIEYWYCKKTTGVGAVGCTNAAECSSDKACP